MAISFTSDELAAKEILAHVGKKIVIGLPLGLGKPVELINALYQLAKSDSSITLTIITGLTFSRPLVKNTLEKNFITPILDRLIGDYVDPLYEKDRLLQQLPPNTNVIEFFFSPGKFLHNAYVQQHYISSSYTNVVRDLAAFDINVMAQAVAPHPQGKDKYSLSCNTDLFHGCADYLKQEASKGKKIAIIAAVNGNLPYMYGEIAEVDKDEFSIIVDTKPYPALFAVPREALSSTDHLIGLYTSCLIPDNGCLQIGIGTLSNALAYSLIMRHTDNALYQQVLHKLDAINKFDPIIASTGGIEKFEQGLYSSTEMLSDEFIQLYDAGIIKKQVYDDIPLQRLLNLKKISETISPDTLNVLLEEQVIHSTLTQKDLTFLQYFGIFKNGITLENDQLILENGERISATLAHLDTSAQEKLLGDKLKQGKLIHAGFFFGSINLYAQLHKFSFTQMQQIEMTSVARTNSLLLNPTLFSLQRENARFVNSSLMVTLLGCVVSDSIENYQVISGVGGQFDFVNMSDQLVDARSIIICRSTRESKNGLQSNIIWESVSTTIPRYLRDFVVTEYGIADCRSKIDEEVIKAMLNITDSRFQDKLLMQAKKAGKLANDYQIPEIYRHNLPATIRTSLQDSQLKFYFKSYPFGSDLTPEEEILARALGLLKKSSKLKLSLLIAASLFFSKPDKEFVTYLKRMDLLKPKSFRDYVYKKLLKYLLAKYITLSFPHAFSGNPS